MLIAILMFIAHAFGINSVLHLLTGEIFPTRCKSSKDVQGRGYALTCDNCCVSCTDFDLAVKSDCCGTIALCWVKKKVGAHASKQKGLLSEQKNLIPSSQHFISCIVSSTRPFVEKSDDHFDQGSFPW